MGFWGKGPFDNDDAADFSAELRDVPTADEVGEICATSFRVVQDASYLEPVDAAEAIAAAVVVAVAVGADELLLSTPYGPGTRASGLLTLWPAAQLEALKFSAFAALQRTLDDERDNEWIDGWQEAGELDEARAALEPLRSALR